MASGANRLVETADSAELKLGDRNPAFVRWTNSPVSITEAGLRVLRGREDYIKSNGIDRWLGGVHLCGAEAVWRWDREASRLTALP